VSHYQLRHTDAPKFVAPMQGPLQQSLSEPQKLPEVAQV
jgi:hypothetical protein